MGNFKTAGFLSVSFESRKEPLDGEDHRSGKNIQLKSLDKQSHMLWKCPENVSFSLKEDISLGKDPVVHKTIKNMTITPFHNSNSLYPADPIVPKEYAENNFLVDVYPINLEGSYKYGLSNWIDTYIKDDTFIRDIMLPGTHDSAAISTWSVNPWACQKVSIEEQLNSGIRLLDIRLKVEIDEDGEYIFQTCHGNVGAGLDLHVFEPFTSVLNTCTKFLEKNCGEFIVMSVKIDDWSDFNKRTEKVNEDKKKLEEQKVFEQLYYYLSFAPTCSFGNMTKGDAKGRVVCIERFSSCIVRNCWNDNWEDNKDRFAITFGHDESDEFTVYVQDKYETTFEKKEELILEAIKQKRDYDKVNVKYNKSAFLLNYCSSILEGTAGLYKSDMNSFVMDCLGYLIDGESKKVNLGWFFFDFATTEYCVYLKEKNVYTMLNVIECVVDANREEHQYYKYNTKFIDRNIKRITNKNDNA